MSFNNNIYKNKYWLLLLDGIIVPHHYKFKLALITSKASLKGFINAGFLRK